ncbi:tRNA-intron lyase [Candidatus Woesearchaeota archaeon]|nr:tRNA-intron lyase [Candidatus Woesearchaeota archaeon]
MTDKKPADAPEEEQILGEFVEEEDKNQPVVEAVLGREFVTAESNDQTRDLYDKGRYGEPQETKQFQYSLVEALYLLERSRFKILKGKKSLAVQEFITKAQKVEANFWTRYCVFKDLRKRGYIVKTALKFGADFRVYDRGVKPGDDHARWIVYPVSEGEGLTWYQFSAKNRVAHSTRKRLLLAIVDAESDVTFYETRWLRP